MLSIQRRPPVDYSKCNQTVTLYRAENGAYSRHVIRGAFLDYRKNRNVDKTGSHESSSFLLVVPASALPLGGILVQDKAMLGEGPEITTREEWGAFIPAKVPGLCVVKYADPKYWNGMLCHVEAGG